MGQELTVREFVQLAGIHLEASPVDRNPHMPDMPQGSTYWRVTMRRRAPERRQMTVFYSMGPGYWAEAPRLEDVLECLASDSAGVENALCSEDWANDLGYAHGVRARRMYVVCQRQAMKLEAFLGQKAYDLLLWGSEGGEES